MKQDKSTSIKPADIRFNGRVVTLSGQAAQHTVATARNLGISEEQAFGLSLGVGMPLAILNSSKVKSVLSKEVWTALEDSVRESSRVAFSCGFDSGVSACRQKLVA
jgi:hypothetical protein